MCNVPMSRREWLKLASLFTVAGAAPMLKSLDARAAVDPDAPVRIGYLPITDATPLLVAHNNGYFDAAGIQAEKPTLLRSWAQLVEAFLSGQVNVVHLLSPMTVWARYGSKAPAKVVAWNHVNGSALTVSPDVNTVADLGGKTVAVPFWYSVHNVVLQDMLRAQGLTPVLKHSGTPGPKEVNLIVMAPSDMPPALASKQIAGYIVAEPFNAAAEQLNVGKILRFTGDVWRNHACCVIFMHEQNLTRRAAWSQKVVDAIVKAQLWTRANPQEAARLLSKEGPNHYTPHAPQLLARVLAPQAADQGRYLGDHAIQHADWNSKRIDFQPYPYPSYTEELVRRLKTTQVDGASQFLASLDPKQVASDLVDDRFVKKSIEASGGSRRSVRMRAIFARRRSLSSVLVREASSPARGRRPASAHWRSVVLGVAGLAATLALWWLAVTLLAGHNAMAAQFAPQRALEALPALVTSDQLLVHVATSLKRIAVGLAWALVVGVPLGFAIGRLRWLEQTLSPTLQFLRMISPLSWMPLAVMSLGVGDRAVYFLLAFAAVWPLVMSTASGVAHLDRRWIQLGESLAATRAEMLWHIYVPGVAAHVLTGVRLAIGILWIVLVPAEMLGVSAGLGYLILDTRDRLAYSELTAVILVIGVLGFLLDLAARAIAARLSSDVAVRDQ